jgi:uncharacterized lipoprotein YmbA
MKPLFLCAVALMLLSGCASSPDTRYFVLEEMPPGAAPSPGSAPMRLTGFHLPPLYDRPQIVVRNGPQSVAMLDYDRWGEPLDRMAARVLRRDLELRAVAGQGLDPALVVTVDDFLADRDGSATLAGNWRIGECRSRHFAFAERLDASDPARIAAGLSTLLGRLADELAQANLRQSDRC